MILKVRNKHSQAKFNAFTLCASFNGFKPKHIHSKNIFTLYQFLAFYRKQIVLDYRYNCIDMFRAWISLVIILVSFEGNKFTKIYNFW